MATRLIEGPLTLSASRNEDRTIDIKVRYQVSSELGDGPITALRTPGLPIPGSPYILRNDRYPLAWCRQNIGISQVTERANDGFYLDYLFSDRPASKAESLSCLRGNSEGNDPLLEPNKISGSFRNTSKEVTYDRTGQSITNSAFEQLTGPKLDFEEALATVRIEQNVPFLQLALLNSMMNTVNAFNLWGMPPRCIRLASVSWDRKFYGQCYHYYTRSLEFELNHRGYDRDLLGESTKAIHGRWSNTLGHYIDIPIQSYTGDPNPNPENPQHFIPYKNRKGDYATCILDGYGAPYEPDDSWDSSYTRVRLQSMVPVHDAAGIVENLFYGMRVELIGSHWYEMEPVFLNLMLGTLPSYGFQYPCVLDGTYTGYVFLLGGSVTLPMYTCPPSGTVLFPTPETVHVEYFKESNFLLLNIPLTIGF